MPVTEICRTRITDRSAWRGEDLQDSDEWIYRLTDEDLDELRAALAVAESTGLATTELREEHFPLERFRRRIAEFVHELEDGRGFLVLRGLPVHSELTEEQAEKIFWGIGQHMGTAAPQNARGHLLGHVIDMGVVDPNLRSYESNGAQDFHCDQSDVVGLLCLRPAMIGGISLLASSVEMHNVMLEEEPELLPLLYETYRADRKNEELPGEPPHYPTSVYTYVDGKLSARLSTGFLRSAQRFEDVPRLSAKAVQAFNYIDGLPKRTDMHLRMKLIEGDMQFQNNYTTVHGRTSFEDDPDRPELRRHMLRLWITLKDGRRLTPDFEARRRGVPQPSEQSQLLAAE